MRLTSKEAEAILTLSGSPHFRVMMEFLDNTATEQCDRVLDVPHDQVDIQRGYAKALRDLVKLLTVDVVKYREGTE